MSNKPIKMNKLRQIIRLYCQGTGIEAFSARSDSELSVIFTTPVAKIHSSPRMRELEPLLPELCKRLKKKGMTREILHKEYLRSTLTVTAVRVLIMPSIRTFNSPNQSCM